MDGVCPCWIGFQLSESLLFGDMKKGNELQLPTDTERQKIMIQRNVGLIPY